MTKTFLSEYVDVRKEIDHINEELLRLQNKMISPRTSVLSDMPKGVSSDFDQMSINLIKLDALREKYVSVLEDLCDRQLQIEEMIQELEPLERDLIRYRYIDGLRWRDVFEKIGYGQRQTFRIHEKIIEKLEKMAHTGT